MVIFMKNDIKNKTKVYFLFSLALTISIDIALVIVEIYQNSINIKAYLIQLCINIYIMTGSLLADFNSFKISKNVEEITFKKYIESIYKNWKLNGIKNDNTVSTVKFNYEIILLPYIRSLIDIIQKSLDLLFCIGVIVILLVNNIIFGFVCIILLIIIFLAVFLLTLGQKKYQKRLIESMSLLQDKILDCYFGIRDIIIYKKQKTIINKVSIILKKVTNAFYKSLVISGMNVCLFNSLDIFLPTLLLIILRKSPAFESFNLICITFYFLYASKKISNIVTSLQNNLVLYEKFSKNLKLKNLFEITLEKKSINSDYEGLIVNNPDGVLINNYVSKISNLKIEKLKVQAGSKTVFVAKVGTGKSVLFRDIFESIGQDNVLYIPSNIELFSGSVMDNIFFEKNRKISSSELEIINTLGFSSDFLYRNFNNNELSGGEKKRIAFLRFYFNRKQINILDEVLSEIEDSIIEKMLDLIKKCPETIILASHNEYVKKNLPKLYLQK